MLIRQLILNFRAALLGVVPSANRVQLAWRRPDAYDDWDCIATALYESLVIEPIRWAVAAERPDDFKMAEYDLELNSYHGLSFLEVLPPDPRGGTRAFYALGTREQPFDTVEYRRVSSSGDPLKEQLEETDLEAVDFVLMRPNDGLAIGVLKSVSVSLSGASAHSKSVL